MCGASPPDLAEGQGDKMGMILRLRRLVSVAALCVSAGALAMPTPVPVPTPESGAEQVQQRKAAAYGEVLAAFDAAMEAAPDDVAIAVARCEFIGKFTDDEYGDWVESAPGEFESCSEALEEVRTKVPVAELFALDQLWGEARVERGEALLEQAGDWPAHSRRALLAKLSQAHAYQDDGERAGELAVEAVKLGDHAMVASAVAWLASHGHYDEATRMLREAPASETGWEAQQRVEAALDLPDRRAALQEWQRYAGSELSAGIAYGARAQLRAGDVEAARRLLQDVGEEVVPDGVRFDVAMASHDHRAAADTVDLANLDDFAQNLVRFATLATTAPATLLTTSSMLVGLAICALLLVAMLLVPGFVLVPVHYRGLVRRLKGRPAVPLFERTGLRHAWYGLAILLAVPSVAAVLLDPAVGVALFNGDTPEATALFRITLWGTLAALACVLPAFHGWSRHQLIGDRATFLGAWRVLLCWGVLIFVAILVGLAHGGGGAPETVQTRTVDALVRGATEAHGVVVGLLLMGLVVPVVEELVFRGLFLGGLSRHISFGWANVIQASLFALSHDDMPRFPFYLALGLLAGWLVKRTGALSPAIALHALNNLLAFGVKLM